MTRTGESEKSGLCLILFRGGGIEWNFEIWFANLDLTKTKAFDRVGQNQLFQALRGQHVPQPYIALLRPIYSSQSGAVHGGRPCEIQRGIKQGDVLSLMFFNAALECALRKWKATKDQVHSVNVLQPEMLRSIVGRVRVNGEDWSETMRRMNHSSEWLWNSSLVHDGRNNLPNANFNLLPK